MLYATSVDEWEQSYKHVEVQCKEKDYVTALEFVRNKIYSNPTKYANYRLKEIPSNRFFMGSTPAEQNHSSIVAHLGKGANWELTEHISNLLQRDRDISQQKASKEILWYDGSTRFLSTYTSTKVIEDDKIARSWMSQYAYEELWTKVVISSRKYVKTNLNDGYVSIHKIGTGLEEGIKIKVGNRCP